MRIRYKILIFMVMIFCFSFIAYAVPVEDVHETMTKSEIFTKIDDEHKNTRKYFTDEMNRQRTQFYKEIDNRGIYYENEFKKMLMETYVRLGLVWGGVVLFVLSLSHILKLKLERNRYNNLRKSLISELRKDLNLQAIKVQIDTIIEEKVPVEIEKGLKEHSYDILQERKKVDIFNEELVNAKYSQAKVTHVEKKYKKKSSSRHNLPDDINI